MQKECTISKINTTAQQIKTEFEENEMENETKDHYKTLLCLLSQDLEKLRNMVSYFNIFIKENVVLII